MITWPFLNNITITHSCQWDYLWWRMNFVKQGRSTKFCRPAGVVLICGSPTSMCCYAPEARWKRPAACELKSVGLLVFVGGEKQTQHDRINVRKVRGEASEQLRASLAWEFKLIQNVWRKRRGLCMMEKCFWLRLLPLQMLLSIAFAAVGVIGGLYSLTVAVLGLQNGPLCKVGPIWSTPFKDRHVAF